MGLLYRILNTNHKKELLRGLWVVTFMILRLWDFGASGSSAHAFMRPEGGRVRVWGLGFRVQGLGFRV